MPAPGQESLTISKKNTPLMRKYYIKYLRTCNEEGYIGSSYSAFVIEMALKGFGVWKKEHNVK